MAMSDKADHSRRNFLYVAAGGLGAVAAGATAIPFVGSMLPAADQEVLATLLEHNENHYRLYPSYPGHG